MILTSITLYVKSVSAHAGKGVLINKKNPTVEILQMSA